MRKLFFAFLFLLFFLSGFSQAPDFKDIYRQLGVNAGYAGGHVKQGMTLGLIHYNLFLQGVFGEISTSKIAFFNENSQSTHLLALDLFTLDAGFGAEFFPGFYFGISPLSLNLTQCPGIGLSVLSKYRLKDKFVLEGKIIPWKYSKYSNNASMLTNNSYLGVQYWKSEVFSIGLRYMRYDYYWNYSFMFSWDI